MTPEPSGLSSQLMKKMTVDGTAPVVLLFVIVSQYILRLDFDCPCASGTLGLLLCVMYMVIPVLTIWLIMLLSDKQLKRIFKRCFRRCCRDYELCCRVENRSYYRYTVWRRVIKSLMIALIWIITTLFDGDWYVCAHTFNGPEVNISCTPNPTQAQKIKLNALRTESKVSEIISTRNSGVQEVIGLL